MTSRLFAGLLLASAVAVGSGFGQTGSGSSGGSSC
jgi:hypothetical protein